MKKCYSLVTILFFALQLLLPSQLEAQCNAPVELSASNVSQTTAYLHLNTTTANALLYNIRYHISGTATWTVLDHVGLPYQLGNLTCGTTYEWQAQLICTNSAGTTVSDWSSGSMFATLDCTTAACNAPIGLSATNVNQTSASLYLNPNSGNTGTFHIRYHVANSTTWTVLENVTLPYQLGNLTCGTTYEWQVRLICPAVSGATTVSPISAIGTFTTLACPTPCSAPSGLSATNVSQTGANLYLSPTSGNTGTFNIRYHAVNATTWTTVDHVTLPYQLGNLTCGTTYEWQVQRICANSASGTTTTSLSDWSTAGMFTTAACTPEPCNAPAGLTATNVSQTGAYLYLTPTSSNTGTFNIRYHVSTSTTWTVVERVTLPYQLGNLACGITYEWQVQRVCTNSVTGAFTVSPWSTGGSFTTLACPTSCNAPIGLSVTNVSQTGSYLYLSPTSGNTGRFNIRYHVGASLTWIAVENVTLPYQLGNLACGTTYQWQAQQICTNSAVGGTTTTVSPWSIVGTFTTLACPPPCNAPIGLTASNVSQTGANLYLSPTSGNIGIFNIRYHAANVTTWTAVEHVTLPFQLGNLTCGTSYEWQVQRICTNTATGAITVSPWSTAGMFTTLACIAEPCNAPIGLTATNVSQTGAYLYLTPTSSNTGTFNIRYHVGSSTTWTVVERVTLPYQLGNLTCGTTYEWQVRRICPTGTGTNTVSPWSASGTFTTLACTTEPCNAPTGLSATNVSQTGANLYLSPTSGNTGMFNIRYHAANVTTWTAVEHVSLPYQLGNLTCGTTYEWQIQRICMDPLTGAPINTVSSWSTAGVFTTLACTTEPCNPPIGLSATNVSQTGANLYLTPTSGNTGMFNIRYHVGTSTTWTAVEHVTLPYQLGNLTCGTTYEWQVQRICTNPVAGSPINIVSPWSAGGTFTTLACTTSACAAPTELHATNINPTSAILHWNPVAGAVAYIVRYKKSNNTSLDFITVTASTNAITINNLMSGSSYIWQVQAVCSTTVGGLSAFSNIATFVTPSVIVYPNPASGYVNVSFWLPRASSVSLVLRDSYGQIVYSLTSLMSEGNNTIQINTNGLSIGLYILTVQTEFYTTTSKVVIGR